MATLKNQNGTYTIQPVKDIPLMPKTKLVDGVRVDIKTGLPYKDQGMSVQPPIPTTPAYSGETNVGTGASSLGSTLPQPQGVDQGDPITKFNMTLMEMLKKAQGASGNEKLFEQERALQRAAIERSSAPTPEELRVLNPSQQSAIRSGKVGALEPEIDAVATSIKAQDSRLRNFESILGQMRDIGGDIINNLAPSKEILEGYKFMLRAGANPTSIPDEIRNKVMGTMTAEDWSEWKEASKTPASPNINIDNENALRGQFLSNEIVKNYNNVQNKKLSVDAILGVGELGGPADLALVYEFMKALDPTSVVRETEYDTASKSGNIFAGAFAKFNGYFKPEGGILPENVKKSFQEIINKKFEVSTQQYKNMEDYFRGIAERQGLDPDNVIVNFGGAIPSSGEGTITTPDGKKWRQLPSGDYEEISFNSVGNTSVSIPQTSRLANVNNNPGNLRYAGQAGATIGEGGFAKFSSPLAGLQALYNQIKLDASRGLTLAQFISKYAPPSENDTNQYIQQVATATSTSPSTRISMINPDLLVRAVANKESGTKII